MSLDYNNTSIHVIAWAYYQMGNATHWVYPRPPSVMSFLGASIGVHHPWGAPTSLTRRWSENEIGPTPR